jgi:hypothetical protein
MSKKKTYKTIKDAAEDLLMEVSYVDVYGRNLGLPYKVVLAKIHELFPNGSDNWPGVLTSWHSLRQVAYALNSSDRRVPGRRRSPRLAAWDYSRALLIDPKGYSFKQIANMVKRKFPDQPKIKPHQLTGLAFHLSKQNFKLPPR